MIVSSMANSTIRSTYGKTTTVKQTGRTIAELGRFVDDLGEGGGRGEGAREGGRKGGEGGREGKGKQVVSNITYTSMSG